MTPEERSAAKPLILASKSAGRRKLLSDAGILHDIVPAEIDEVAIRAEMTKADAQPRQIGLALAREKALAVSAARPDRTVLGSDQLLLAPDHTLLSKAETKDAAIAKLTMLSGKTHHLISAAVIYRDGRMIWHDVDVAVLTMRKLPNAQIRSYVDCHWEEIKYCVGCYRIEAEGRQLFDLIEGEESTIIGMPMMALLDYLNTAGYGPPP